MRKCLKLNTSILLLTFLILSIQGCSQRVASNSIYNKAVIELVKERNKKIKIDKKIIKYSEENNEKM